MAEKKMTYKVCLACRMAVPRSGFGKNNKAKDGLRTYCKKCRNLANQEYRESKKGRGAKRKYREENKDMIAAQQKRYREKNQKRISQLQKKYNRSEHGRRKQRKAPLRALYGLSIEQHERMYLGQEGQCAVCGEAVPYSKINTDHDHKTGEVRGLLCYKCNLGLGFFGDTYEGVMRAADYLRGTNGR